LTFHFSFFSVLVTRCKINSIFLTFSFFSGFSFRDVQRTSKHCRKYSTFSNN
jgi:hypothetical protein